MRREYDFSQGVVGKYAGRIAISNNQVDADKGTLEENISKALAYRELNDGRSVWVYPMTFGKARIVIGKTHSETIDDAWCYETWEIALAALAAWNPQQEPEPHGWMRHPMSGRRRPGGDAAQEYVRL